MALTKITGKDFKEAVDWLLKYKQGCVHQVLGRTDEGTELCLVIGWADIGYDLEEVKKNGYEDEGHYICSKIGYQHRNNGMQSDFEWDFPMPYNPETGDVWDTDTYVAKGDEQSWQTDADMYNKEAEKIWATWGVPNEDGQTTLDIMESKKKEAKKNEKLFMLYDIHHNYPDFGKMSCWRNPQFWKDYEDYYSKAYPTMGIKITMKDNDSVDVTSNGKFIMNYSWKNGRHRATAEDGSGFKHPGFGFRDDLSMIYRGATGKAMGPYQSVYVDESKKKEAKNHTCSMQKKKESLAKKNEGASDTIKVTAENVMLTVNDVYVDDHGGSFSVETPEEGKSYNLLDMQEMIRGMCEDCTGYANYSRDGSELLIEVMAGEMDDNGEWTGDYYKAYSFRCTARIMSYSLEGIIDFLDESN